MNRTPAPLPAETLEYLDAEKVYQGIQEAKKNIDGIAHRTKLWYSSTLSELTQANIYLKLENMQKTGSFKVRGALNAVSKLSEAQKAAGVIAASSGNHAQAVAYAASRLGIKATIVMPKSTPVAKVEATKGYKANVILYGDVFDEALAYAKELSQSEGMYFLHPFNDDAVIEGQGTIGLEIVEDFQKNEKPVDVVVIPVGGGGLSTGIAVSVKKHFPEAKIYGVEAASCNSMELSLKEGKVTGPMSISTICDGISVKRPGTKTLPLAQKYFDGVALVEDLEVSHAMFMLLERKKIVVEPSGATGLAAVLNNKIDIKGKNVCIVLSGGNVDMSLMSRIIQQQLLNIGRKAVVKGEILDKSGVLNDVLLKVATAGLKVVSIQMERSLPKLNPVKAMLVLELELPNSTALPSFIEEMKKNGITFKRVEVQ